MSELLSYLCPANPTKNKSTNQQINKPTPSPPMPTFTHINTPFHTVSLAGAAARHYDSGLSLWLSVDPMSDKYPSTSPYTYCANNPVRLVDPNGEFPIPKHWKFVRDAFAKRINRITLCKIQYGNGVRADILHAGRSSTHMDNMKGTAEISSAYRFYDLIFRVR